LGKKVRKMENTPICEKKILGNFSENLGYGIPYRRNFVLSRIFIINYKNNMKKVIKLTESELVSMVKKKREQMMHPKKIIRQC
jgi:hypothetical protein